MRGVRGCVVLLVSAALLSACGSSGSSSEGDATGAPNTGREKQPIATITWAKAGEVTGLDPQVIGQAVSWDILFRIYEPLVQLGDDGTITPLLATSWRRVSPTVYDFQLRRNARFSNGRPVTSADVVASFERVLDPKLGSYALSRLGVIERVTAKGRHAVRFTLERPSGTFLAGLAGIAASILPAKELEAGTFDPNKDTLGTGPYMVDQHRQEESWTLVRNPHYWREGFPRADKLVVLIVPDLSARMAALRSGRADIATSDDPDTPTLLEGTPNVEVVPQASSDFYMLYLNAIATSSKLTDERVRQAIAAALDRRQIIELALGGEGEPMAGGGTVPGLPDACDVERFAAPDPDRARTLLAEANADGLEFEIEVNTGLPIFGKIAQVIQAQLEDVGLRPAVRPTESGAALDNLRKGRFDMDVSYMTAFVDNWFGLANWSPSTVGFTKPFAIDDPEYDRLLDEAARLEPGGERAAVFQRMCELAAERADIVPLATRTLFIAYRTDRLQPVLQEFEAHSNPLRYVAEFAGA